VALGIAIADLLVIQIGTGTLQLALVVLLATSAAIFLGSGQMLATQAAVSAALVATLQPPTDGVSFARFLDALVGGGVALVINALVLPARPLDLMRRASEPLLGELAAVLEDVAVAVDHRDKERAVASLQRARAIDELAHRFEEAVDVSRETTRYAPPRRRARGLVESYADAAGRIDLAVRNVRVLARATIRALSLDENVPPEIAGALRDLAAAVRALTLAIADPDSADAAAAVREPAARAAAEATLVLERTGNMSVSVIVGQIRSTAADLIAATGMSHEGATGAVREAIREAERSL
jgi:uncharacterized membrane protein YgaE (UPF0421/DUF939 family)